MNQTIVKDLAGLKGFYGLERECHPAPDSSVYMLSHQGMALFEKDKEVWLWSGRGLVRGSVSLWVGFEVLAWPTVFYLLLVNLDVAHWLPLQYCVCFHPMSPPW